MLSGIFSSCISFIFFALTHTMLFHWKKIDRQLKALQLLWLCFLPLYVVSFYIFSKGSWETAIFFSGLLFYFTAAYFYGQLYFQVARGLSMRLLVEIENSPEKNLTFEALKLNYDFNFILARRLAFATDSQMVVREDEGNTIRLTKKGYRTAKILGGIKAFLNLDPLA